MICLHIFLIYISIGFGLMYYGRSLNPPVHDKWYMVALSYIVGALFWPLAFIGKGGER